jgi:MarR family transcriptional regulator, negative regulator of the multidrug operon emrRAB
MKTNSKMTQFELVEANLQNLSARVPDVPATGILMCRLLIHVGHEMAVLFEHQIRPFGLAEAEFRVLTTLFSQPGGVAHPSDLCARASQSPTNMSRICDALVSRGLITRDLSLTDRRRMVLRITEQGEQLVRQLLPKLFAPLRELLKDNPEAEQRQLNDQLKRLGFGLEQASATVIAKRAV